MTTSRSESDEQIGFIAWWDASFPAVRIFHVPNGGHRQISVAKRLKDEGVRPGVPDLFAPAWLLWIEMKRTRGGRLSADQKDWIEYLQSIGHTVIVARGARDASAQVIAFLRERRAGRAE